MSGAPGKRPGEARDHEFGQQLTAPAGGPSEHLGVDDMHKVTLPVTADLGQCTLLVRDVLELKRGSVLPLNKLAGEMADVYVGGVPFAKGEIVVLGDSLHVRIAEIIGAAKKEEGEHEL